MTNKTYEQVEQYLKDYLINNCDLMQLVSELRDYDDSLDHLCYQLNDDEFFEIYFHNKTMEAVRAVCYGEYEYLDDYVKFNGHGNLVSKDKWELQKELESNIDEILESVLENHGHIELDDKTKALVELLERDIEEMKTSEFIDYLENEYDIEIEEDIDFSTMEEEELAEKLAEHGLDFYMLSDNLETVLDVLEETDAKLVNVDDYYITIVE